MYYNIKIKVDNSEFSLESNNKEILEREMDLYFSSSFDVSEEFKKNIKKVDIILENLKSIQEFEEKEKELKKQQELQAAKKQQEETIELSDIIVKETESEVFEKENNKLIAEQKSQVEVVSEETYTNELNVSSELEIEKQEDTNQSVINSEKFEDEIKDTLDESVNNELLSDSSLKIIEDIKEKFDKESNAAEVEDKVKLEESKTSDSSSLQINTEENKEKENETSEEIKLLSERTVNDIKNLQDKIEVNSDLKIQNIREESEENLVKKTIDKIYKEIDAVDIESDSTFDVDIPDSYVKKEASSSVSEAESDTINFDYHENEQAEENNIDYIEQTNSYNHQDEINNIFSSNSKDNEAEIKQTEIQSKFKNNEQNEAHQQIQENLAQQTMQQTTNEINFDVENETFDDEDVELEETATENLSDRTVEVAQHNPADDIVSIFSNEGINSGLEGTSAFDNVIAPANNFEEKKEFNLDFKIYLSSYKSNGIIDEFLICAYYVKNVLRQDTFTMKYINSKIFQATGKIADMSVVEGLVKGGYIREYIKDNSKKYAITTEGEEYFGIHYQQ